MYRLMIVDDHEYLIEGLRKFINWGELNLEVLDVAANGEEGLQKIRRLRPNIVLTDISMPVMDGLEMIRELCADNLGCKFIILTGHGDFDYAREAIKYGVMDFILKPVMPREITEVLRRAVAACEAERQMREQEQRMKQQLLESLPVLTQRFLEDLFDGAIGTASEFDSRSKLLNLDLCGDFRVLSARIDDYGRFLAERDENERRFLKFSMETTLCEALGVQRSFLGFKDRSAALLLCRQASQSDEVLEAQLEALVCKLRVTYGVSLTIGVGGVGDTVTHIRDSYVQSLECLQHRGVADGSVIFHTQLMRDAQTMPAASGHADPRTAHIIEQVLEAIHQDCSRDITLQDLAKRVYLTPNYLGALFSKCMGRSFLDYLAWCRVQKAAEYLQSGKYLVYEVSELVGYRDHDYFRRVFKDYMGVTPSQYMK